MLKKKRETIDWRKIFTTLTLVREILSIVYEECLQLNSKKIINPIKDEQRI